jgi:carbonyl reductase 1
MARTVVVTGANKGIGACIAEQLYLSGEFGRVILACRNEEEGRKAAARLGAGAEFALLDISDPASIDYFAKHMATIVLRCDGLINNAAIAFKQADPTPFAQQAAPTLGTNYRGTVRLTDALLPLLRAGERPFVVNVASMAGALKQIPNAPLREQFAAPDLSRVALDALVQRFQEDVQVFYSSSSRGSASEM